MGAIICENNTAKVCDGNCGFTSETPCVSPQVCAPNLGCVVCTPGDAMCVGQTSVVCNADGLGTTSFPCDPAQGVTCNPNTGLCEGDCAPAKLGQTYFGCDFYPTITNNDLLTSKASCASCPGAHFAVAVANTTPATANITITRGAMAITTATVAANSVQVINLDWIAELDIPNPVTQISTTATGGAYRLRSTKPVTVYQYNPLEYTSSLGSTYTNDASLLLPVNALTGNYRVVARNCWAWVGGPSNNYLGLYAVTATENATTVNIQASPSGGTIRAGAGLPASGSGTVMLNQGDVLQVFCAKTNSNASIIDPSDNTGTAIAANKPVMVMGGHMCTNVPHNIPYCDHIEEVMAPLETIALSYIVTSAVITPNSDKVRMVRITAHTPNTTLSYEPPQGGAPSSIAAAGGYVEIPMTAQNFRITASDKVYVSEYLTGQDAGGNSGDPAQAMSVPTAQYRDEYLFHAPMNYQTAFVNVVAPTNAVVTLDGMPATGFTAIGTTGYRVAKLALCTSTTTSGCFNGMNGNHSITGSVAFGITVYGYGQYTSYWYPGGLDLTPLGL